MFSFFSVPASFSTTVGARALDRSDVRGRELRRWSPSAREAVNEELRQRGGTTEQAMARVRASVR